MKVVGEFNKVSNQLKNERIPKFSSGALYHFQLTQGEYDVQTGRTVFGASRSIRLRDRIFDPYGGAVIDGKPEGCYVDIGVPKTYDVNGRVDGCEKFWVESITNGVPGNGAFTLDPSKVKDMEIIEFLLLCNENESNPNRDKSVISKFKEIDAKKDAKENIKKRSMLRDALNLAERMTDYDMKEFAASRGWDQYADPAVLRDKIEAYATDKPKDFVELMKPGSNKKLLAKIKLAMDKEVVKYDPAQHRIVWGDSDETIAALEREEGKKPMEMFEMWISKSASGHSVMGAITKKLQARMKDDPDASDEIDQ